MKALGTITASFVRLDEDIDSNDTPPTWQLYDLASDVGEQKDIAAEHPEVVRELAKLFDEWSDDMHPSIVRIMNGAYRPKK